MKNESLISEIYRIQEVMGIPNKKLLLEQAWVEDLLAALSKLAKNFDDEFDTLLTNVSNESLEKNVRANNLDKLIRKAKNMGDEDVLRVINDVLTSPDGSLINSIKNIVSSEEGKCVGEKRTALLSLLLLESQFYSSWKWASYRVRR